MDWLQAVDGYCERLGPGYWAEPVNALTNLGFVVLGLWLWGRTRGAARGLAGLMVVIGLGSWLFHTHANRLTGLMDVTPILAFILTYIVLAARNFLGWRGIWPFVAAGGFLAFAAVTVPLFARLPGIGTSAGYAPVPVAMLAVAALAWRANPAAARGLVAAAAVLCLSIAARSADMPLCGNWPLGTHFLWHLLNAVLLAGLVVLYRDQGQARK